MSIVVLGTASGAGAQSPTAVDLRTPSVQKGQWSEMNPLPHAATTLALARHFGDTSYDDDVARVGIAVATEAQLGRPISLEHDAEVRRITATVYERYAERLVVDALGGERNYNLAKFAARVNAPADCSNDLSVLWGIDHKTKVIKFDTKNAKASVSFTLDKPLCQPVSFELQSWKKIDGKPFPAPQVVNDVVRKEVQAAGTYTWEVALPTETPKREAGIGDIINAVLPLVCAAQVDFTRSEGFGPDGAVIPSLIDFAQFDVATPEEPQFAEANAFPADLCVSDNQVAGEQVSRGGVLPTTGRFSMPLFFTALGLIALGWICLAARATAEALENAQK